MSKAYKCDRCGKYYEDDENAKAIGLSIIERNMNCGGR